MPGDEGGWPPVENILAPCFPTEWCQGMRWYIFFGAKIIQTLVLQALANTSHSWQRSRVFRPKFLVNILRFGSKKNINIHQPKANLPILTRFSRHAWWLNSLQDSPWHHGIRVRGQPGCWCSAAQQWKDIAHYRRDRAHLKIPQTHTSPSRFECLNVERLKESRFVAWKPQHFGKVLPCMEFKHGNTRGPHKNAPSGESTTEGSFQWLQCF